MNRAHQKKWYKTAAVKRGLLFPLLLLLSLLTPFSANAADCSVSWDLSAGGCKSDCMKSGVYCSLLDSKSWCSNSTNDCATEAAKPANPPNGSYSMNCNNNTWSMSCNGGYTSCDGSTCQANITLPNCSSANTCTGKCSSCNGGYTTCDGGTTCQANTSMAHCDSLNQCTGKCSTCSGGYTTCDGGSTCQANITLPNCTTVNQCTGLCTACNNGYTLSGGACVGATLKLSGSSVGSSSPFYVYQSAEPAGLYVTSDLKVGISTGNPSYLLHVATSAGVTNTLLAVSTGATNVFWAAGDGAHATRFFGDGSGLTGVVSGPADNLGNHTATMSLNMNGNSIINAASGTFTQGITASSFTATNTAGAGLLVNSSAYLAVSGGSVGIGTTSPMAGLDIISGTSTAYSLSVGTSTAYQMVISTTGSVGIGTLTPGYRLEITGGDLNLAGSGVYRKAGAAGTNISCGGSQVLTGGVVSGGIMTGGACADNGGVGSDTCDSDSVLVGNICVDKYEASVWSNAGGGTQWGAASNNYPCNANGQDCASTNKIYARSEAGRTPSANITWFQASAACRNSGKRLLTNAEWTEAANGTPDPGATGTAPNCNVSGSGPTTTGAGTSCLSAAGAENMIGSLWEWVADWGTAAGDMSGAVGWGEAGYNGDAMWNIGGSAQNSITFFAGIVPGISRGGSWGNGSLAGVFALNASDSPSYWHNDIGFRCGKPLKSVIIQSGSMELSQDLTPQLGGDLDVNGHKIVSASNGNIIIIPDGAGNIGIGTAAPATKLHVSGGVLTVDGSGAGITTTGGITASSFTALGASLGVDTAKVRFTDNGIIVSSASPAQYGGVYISTNVYLAAGAKFYGDGSGLNGGDNLGNHIATKTLNMSAYDITNVGNLTANSVITAYSTMTVAGNAFSVGGSTFVIKDGNVGIGTTNPQAPLHVYNANSDQIMLEAGTGNYAYLGLWSGTTDANHWDIAVKNTEYSSALQFRPGGGAPSVVFQTSGNVGIGTVAPATKLHLSGGVLTVDGSGAGITTTGGITASSFTALGASLGVDTAKVRFTDTGIIVSSASPAQYGGVYISTNVYLAPGAKYYGDGSGLLGGDNLGNHVATTTLNMSGFQVVNVSTIVFTGLNGGVVISPSLDITKNYAYTQGVALGGYTYGNYTNGVGVGYSAQNNYNNGVGVGYSALNNYNMGIGVGPSSQNNHDDGVGVGDSSSNNYSYGVGLGASSSNNYSYGVGVGSSAHDNYNHGVGVGNYALNNSTYAVGIGANSQNNQPYGSALGAYSYAASSSTALGSYAKANAKQSIAIGAGTISNSTGAAEFGLYAINTSSNLFVGGSVGIGTTSPPAALSLGTYGASLTWLNLYFGNYPTSGGAQLVGNWPGTNFWGIGPLTGAADNTVRIGNTTNRTGTWSPTQNLNLVIGGNVGIGTASPAAQLDVAGQIQASSASFTTTGNAAYNVGLRVSSSAYLATAGGYVGIGTAVPVAALDVNGTAKISKYLTQANDAGITLTTADFGKTITLSSSTAQTITLPSVTVSDIGAQFTIIKLGTGQVTIQAAGGTYIADSGAGKTIYNNSAAETYATITLRLTTSTRWSILGGDGSWTTTN